MATPTFTQRSMLSLIIEVDPEFERERRNPIVYYFSNGKTRRDPGDQGGPYANHPHEE